MVGFMNDEAWTMTQRSGFATFYSRSRNQLWTKGETSGNRLAVRQILIDCDEDTVLLKVERLGDGNVCHTGARSCFTPSSLQASKPSGPQASKPQVPSLEPATASKPSEVSE